MRRMCCSVLINDVYEWKCSASVYFKDSIGFVSDPFLCTGESRLILTGSSAIFINYQ